MKLILGTAQFGFKYGLNKKKIGIVETKKILKIIKKNNLTYFDTAIDYGTSQSTIGNFDIKKNIITKIVLPKKNIKNIKDWFYKEINLSLKKLKVKRIYGLLIHNSSVFTKSKNKYKFIKLLQDAKNKNIISYYGISVYDKEEVNQILRIFKPDILQFPSNIFDHRFLDNGFLKKLKRLNIKIMARSCFLQGILLQSSLNKGSNKTKKIFSSFLEWCNEKKITQIEACIQFMKKFKLIDYLIVGFDNANHLLMILKIFGKKKIYVPNIFSCTDLKLIDPRKW